MELKQEPVLEQVNIKPFLEMAKSSVVEGIEAVKDKGVGIRFSADYCNAIVTAMKQKSEFKGYSDTEVKMALKPLFEAVVLNSVAKELKVITE